MKLDDVITSRRSVREFSRKKAPWDKVLEAVDSAIQAPAASNSLPLKFIIIENPKTIHKLAECSNQSWISNSGIVVVVCSNNTSLKTLYDEKGEIYGRQQTGAAIENFLLKITDLGLATCWIGSFDEERVKEYLKIPQGIDIEAILPIGYAKKKVPKPKKPSLEASIFWEEWDTKRRSTIIKDPKTW